MATDAVARQIGEHVGVAAVKRSVLRIDGFENSR